MERDNREDYFISKVSISEVEIVDKCPQFQAHYVIEKMIDQEGIDSDYYYVQVRNIESYPFEGNKEDWEFVIRFLLIRRPEWKDLEECDERLRSGL